MPEDDIALTLERVNIPPNIIEQLKFYCESINHGFVTVSGEGFSIVLIGNVLLSPDQISILAAHSLLEGVIGGRFTMVNNDALEKSKGITKKEH